MHIILIQPPYTILKSDTKSCQPPLGLSYLAAVLRKDYEVTIIDSIAEGYDNEERINKNFIRYGLSFEKIKEKIKQFKPDAVGVSCLFSSQIENSLKVCEIIKSINTKIFTIIGGAHPSAMVNEVLENRDVDFVIIGEGENTVIHLLKEIEGNKNFNIIDGIGYREKDKIRIQQKTTYIEDLDKIPFPAWDLLPLEIYFKINRPHGAKPKRRPFLPIITSRGCPNNCVFCSIHCVWGKSYRKRSSENVLSEIDFLTNHFNLKELHFEDDNLALDKKRAIEIFHGILCRGYDLTWSVPNGLAINTLDKEVLELMKKSGCYNISLAVESGSQKVLRDIIKKPVNLIRAKQAIMEAKKLGFDISTFFVVGFPDETKEDLMETLSLATSLNVENVNFFFATPLPGSPLFEQCKRNGTINENLLDYKMLNSYKPNFPTKELSKKELYKLIKRGRIKVYISLLLRKPQKFIMKFWHKVLSEPKFFLKFFKNSY